MNHPVEVRAPLSYLDAATERYLTDFRNVIEEHHDRCWKEWRTIHLEAIKGFSQALGVLIAKNEQSLKKEKPLQPVWDNWAGYLEQHRTFVIGLSNLYKSDSLSTSLLNWNSVFAAYVQSVPQETKYRVVTADWLPEAGDSLRIKIWKKTHRVFYLIISLFRKKNRPAPIYYRVVGLRDFCHYYLEHSSAVFLFDEWNSYLQYAGGQLVHLHTGTRDIIRQFMFLENAENTVTGEKAELLLQAQKQAQQFIQTVERLAQDFDGFVESRRLILADWLEGTMSTFASKWRFAGTAIRSHKEYDRMAIDREQRSLNNRFTTCAEAWIKHFQGEGGDWLTDIVLQGIQLNAGLSYQKCDGVIVERIQYLLLPTFGRASAVVGKTARAFDAVGKPASKTLRNLIDDESNALLHALRSKVLPEIANAFLSAQLNQAISEFHQRIVDMANKQPERETIMTKRGIDSTPPQSQTETIPLKEFFRRDFLPDLEAKVTDYNTEVQQTLSRVMNSAAELDQVVEFNLKVALDVLRDKKDPVEALRHVKEGLQRVQERIGDHIEKIAAIQKNSQQRLHDTSLSFIQKVQTLLDNEKLVELKLQLMHAQAKEKFRQTRHDIWRFIIRAVPFAWSNLVRGFQFFAVIISD